MVKPQSTSSVLENCRRLNDVFVEMFPKASDEDKLWHASVTNLAYADILQCAVNHIAFIADGSEDANFLKEFFSSGASSALRSRYPVK